LWVSHTPDVSADLTILNSTLNLPSWLAIARGNGNTGICNLTLTNATVNVGNFSSGYNNALAANSSQAFITQSNSIFNNAGTTHIAESPDSAVTWVLSNGSTYTAGNTFNIGGAGTASGAVFVQDTSSIIKGATGAMVIGNSGIGSLSLEGNSLLSVPGSETYIGNAGLTTVGVLSIKDSATANFGGTLFVGKSNVDGTGTSSGTLIQTGGTVNAAAWLVVGRYVGANGTYNISGGTVNQTSAANAMIVGEAGTGVLNVSDTAVVNVQGNYLSIGHAATGVGTVNLNGGIIIAKRVIELAGGGTSMLNLNGGVLKAASASTDFITVDAVDVQTGGAIIDTNGFEVIVAKDLAGVGGLTKQGTGTLTLANALNYAGATTVNAGTLALGSATALPPTTTLVLNSATMDLRNGSASRLADVAGLTLNGGTLLIGMSGTTHDALNVTGAVTAPGNATIKLFGTLANGQYNLITSAAALPSSFSLDTTALAGGFTQYSGAVSGANYVLTVAGTPTPTEAYWLGDVSGVWNDATVAPNSNWATSAAGTTDTKQIPGLETDVYFQAAGAANTNTTLGIDYTVDSLTFTAGTASVGGANLLTLAGENLNLKALEVQNGATANIALTQLAYAGETLVATGGTLNVTGGSLGATTGSMQVDGTLKDRKSHV
jgi:autotransporter-associated beta strand protein